MDGREENGAPLEQEPNAVSSIPSSPISIDISLPIPEMQPKIADLCKDLFKKWSCLDNSCFLIERISGGFTNLMLKVSVREASGNDVFLTVRVFGPDTDLLIDRKREWQALPHLSAAGFGAELLGKFENGLVQSFIDARTLDASDMCSPKIAADIARQLRKFHQVEVPGPKEPQLWNDIFKFLEKAATLTFEDSEKQAQYETLSFKDIRDDVNTLKDLTDLLKAPVVFCHNDLLSGNLMLNEKEGKLYFIDFEYGSYSYRGYDIANHFNEYAGYTCDYSLFPDKNAQYHFFRNYLNPDRPHEVPDKDLEDLYVETNTLRIAAHLYWFLWALIQANVSKFGADYLLYSFARYIEYQKQKEDCFLLARNYLSAE